jgi:hypothetical protein
MPHCMLGPGANEQLVGAIACQRKLCERLALKWCADYWPGRSIARDNRQARARLENWDSKFAMKPQ